MSEMRREDQFAEDPLQTVPRNAEPAEEEGQEVGGGGRIAHPLDRKHWQSQWHFAHRGVMALQAA